MISQTKRRFLFLVFFQNLKYNTAIFTIQFPDPREFAACPFGQHGAKRAQKGRSQGTLWAKRGEKAVAREWVQRGVQEAKKARRVISQLIFILTNLVTVPTATLDYLV